MILYTTAFKEENSAGGKDMESQVLIWPRAHFSETCAKLWVGESKNKGGAKFAWLNKYTPFLLVIQEKKPPRQVSL